jgi:cytochrome c oxidase subunit 2
MQSKFWSILFGAVLLACFLSLVISPFVGWWLPENVATFGGEIDYLFYVILVLTGIFFVLTEAILVWVMWKYAYDPNRRAVHVEGNHKLEMWWTIIPGAILLYIAFAQISAWRDIKYQTRVPPADQVIKVDARQWEWRMRYPGEMPLENPRAWAENPAYGDVRDINAIHTWKGANVHVYLHTQDVLHSLFIPNLRLKQDALPGRTIHLWFNATRANAKFDPATKKMVQLTENKADEWEIACAELCGGRHYQMRGRLYVHETEDNYLEWLRHTRELQQDTSGELE